MSKTQPLDLDFCQREDLPRIPYEAPYPPLNKAERTVLDTVAEGLCISKSSLYWAYYDPQLGERWKRLRQRLLSPKVSVVKE